MSPAESMFLVVLEVKLLSAARPYFTCTPGCNAALSLQQQTLRLTSVLY